MSPASHQSPTQYLSPVSVFGGALPQPLDIKAIQLGRKKLLAEIELNSGNEIEIHGNLYGRNDIILYFESLLKENALEYHQAIREDGVLLRFLEDDRIKPGERFNDNPLYNDKFFIHWISPYFSMAFRRIINTCFETIDDLTLATVIRNPLLMADKYEDDICANLAILIKDNIDFLKSYQTPSKKRSKSIRLTQVSDLMEFEYTRMIRLLPMPRFGELRNKYAFAMMQVCLYTFNRNPRKRGLTTVWMANAESLAISSELKNQISDFLQVMRSSSGMSRMPILLRFILLPVILVLVIILIRIIGSYF
jgi:hypothetical protein